MSKYEKLDAAILNKMGGHPRMFSDIYVRDVQMECNRIASEVGNRCEATRVLDRRLQALRKAGKIKSSSKGWTRGEQQ